MPRRELPAGRRKRAHEVADRLETAITDGEFSVGDQLPTEKELMERFGVGRPAVREALFMLQQRGHVETLSGTRARVTAPTSSFLVGQLADMAKSFTGAPQGQKSLEQVRLLFESGLAWNAAQVATDEDILQLKAALDANVAALGNAAQFVRTDVAFHHELTRIARNPIFDGMHDVLTEWLFDQRTTTIHMTDADKLSVRDHSAIYEAVAARDPARAFHEMASHLRLISRLYDEAKRLAASIMREVTQDVARQIEQENKALWEASFGVARTAQGGKSSTSRRKQREMQGERV